ncbi:MAG: type II toxin-antitoxin system HicA family toxin [Candidatus Odinarchaeota archaeon]|nr:type II toxin-antitoxin system HicA family toxin [Candidatus Odinarchaeota archaeon]
MTKKLPVLSGKELVKVLKKVGFIEKRQKGSHVILVKIEEKQKFVTVIPLHKEIDRGTLVEIIRQAGLTRDDFLRLYYSKD